MDVSRGEQSSTARSKVVSSFSHIVFCCNLYGTPRSYFGLLYTRSSDACRPF